MQSIAGEFNLAETTFVLPPKDPAHTAQVLAAGLARLISGETPDHVQDRTALGTCLQRLHELRKLLRTLTMAGADVPQ